jgi:S-adenosylmethionine-diacylglycerol 3-amino-3-carboxypropyl transferase
VEGGRIVVTDARQPLAARLNYAQCWEDVRLLFRALEPAAGRHLLSVASAGDNSIALALRGARVTALDLSAPQIACTELKLAGRVLEYPEFRRMLGLDPGSDRGRLYEAVRPHLSVQARGFWDGRRDLIEQGILGVGRFETYLETFRTRVLPLIHRRATTLKWFQLETLEEQRRFWEERWDNLRWRALFRVFFSRRVMAARGRSPEQFAHVEGPIGDALLSRARHVLTELPLRDNGYVQWMLAGTYLTEEGLPPYLTEDGHARLGEVAERLELVHASLEDHLEGLPLGIYDGFNLSDIFEYLTEAHTESLLAALARVGKPGARLAYWNLFVPRSRPASLADRLEPLADLAASLVLEDRAFVYGAFRVEEVR